MCCTATRWVERMVENRPFTSVKQIQTTAASIWQTMEFDDFMEAFSGHPKIGDPDSLKEKFRSSKQLAEDEQSEVQNATDEVIEALAIANKLYERLFGYIFIVCATGKSAAEMLELVEKRLENEAAEELTIAAGEQAKITAIRINKMLGINNPCFD